MLRLRILSDRAVFEFPRVYSYRWEGYRMANHKDLQKEALKGILRDLHRGLPVEEAKERFEREVGEISSTEIASLEQSLIDEGVSPEEIKKFCNVHALLFQEALEQTVTGEESPGHPVFLFKLENREIEKMTASLRETMEGAGQGDWLQIRQKIKEQLIGLEGLELHYTRKEHLLFPYLERCGFMGPSKVMWGKDNEIRDLYKETLMKLNQAESPGQLRELIEGTLAALIEEVEGMIFKEENILFPTSMEKLSASDWVDILKESGSIGYAFIENPGETEQLVRELEHAAPKETAWEGGEVAFPTGRLYLKELTHILNALPVELTFVDADDTVRYFSDSRGRTFVRTKSVIGRKVHNCHPPQSVDLVEKILSSFKAGTRDSAEFWLEIKGRMINIEFLAIRDEGGRYLGTLELTQDITELKKREGERRIFDESN